MCHVLTSEVAGWVAAARRFLENSFEESANMSATRTISTIMSRVATKESAVSRSALEKEATD
jgi:hypothetical protein